LQLRGNESFGLVNLADKETKKVRGRSRLAGLPLFFVVDFLPLNVNYLIALAGLVHCSNLILG
jgi:hypothetical protein